jgi:hypothetical protein
MKDQQYSDYYNSLWNKGNESNPAAPSYSPEIQKIKNTVQWILDPGTSALKALGIPENIPIDPEMKYSPMANVVGALSNVDFGKSIISDRQVMGGAIDMLLGGVVSKGIDKVGGVAFDTLVNKIPVWEDKANKTIDTISSIPKFLKIKSTVNKMNELSDMEKLPSAQYVEKLNELDNLANKMRSPDLYARAKNILKTNKPFLNETEQAAEMNSYLIKHPNLNKLSQMRNTPSTLTSEELNGIGQWAKNNFSYLKHQDDLERKFETLRQLNRVGE